MLPSTDYVVRPVANPSLIVVDTAFGGKAYVVTTAVVPPAAGTQYTATVSTLLCSNYTSSDTAAPAYTSV